MVSPRPRSVGAADLSARYPRAEFRAGRLEDLRLPDGQFDLVAAVEVLYYLDPEARAALLARVGGWLAPGGHLLISTRMKDTLYFRAAEALCLRPGWLRAGAAALGVLPGASPTYRVWFLRKPKR